MFLAFLFALFVVLVVLIFAVLRAHFEVLVAFRVTGDLESSVRLHVGREGYFGRLVVLAWEISDPVLWI